MHNTKKLILVGNKILSTPLNNIENFDYIFRVNRMNNLGMTGNRIDGLFLGAYSDFKYLYKGGENKERIKEAKQIFMTEEIFKDFKEWRDFITEEQLSNIKFLDFKSSRQRNKGYWLTSTIQTLDCLLNDKSWTDNYEIYITGLDIEDRGNIMRVGAPWRNTPHSITGVYEEEYLKDKVNKGIIKVYYE